MIVDGSTLTTAKIKVMKILAIDEITMQENDIRWMIKL